MSDELGRHTQDCDRCNGKGSIMVTIGVDEVDHDECPKCQGKGFITEDEEERW